ncbi:hypothetical protein ACN38_g11804 [Penicillium nordicum]|uniref:Uncharacterized protein n=1 Tax=Penicillium nordicum TaxID=229535 RepID=A0A0M9WAI0_9EURO|nr:hypothetical protein ACN38_g11804 [Penicillium nordicum]
MFRWTFGHYFPEFRHAEISNDALTAETPRLGGASPHLPNSPIRQRRGGFISTFYTRLVIRATVSMPPAHNSVIVYPIKIHPALRYTPKLAAKRSANFLQVQFSKFNSL